MGPETSEESKETGSKEQEAVVKCKCEDDTQKTGEECTTDETCVPVSDGSPEPEGICEVKDTADLDSCKASEKEEACDKEKCKWENESCGLKDTADLDECSALSSEEKCKEDGEDKC